jgi:hypothetical protein
MPGDGSRRNREGDEVRYFTPDLLAKCRSSDPDVAESAATKWEGRAEAYRKRLHEIHPGLPFGARRMMRSVTLHDACLLDAAEVSLPGRSHQLFLLFQLADSDGRAVVQLRYVTVNPPKMVKHESYEPGDTRRFALYDEFDVSADGVPTHSILLTGGVEIRIRFTRLFITSLTRVVVPGRAHDGGIKHGVELLKA